MRMEKMEKIEKIRKLIGQLIGQARELRNKKEYLKSFQTLEEAKTIVNETKFTIKEVREFYAEICQVKATIYQRQGDFSAAEKELRRALDQQEKISDIKGIAYTTFQFFILSVLRGEPNSIWWDKATQSTVAALLLPDLAEEHRGNFLHNLAFLSQSISDYYNALDTYRSALVCRQKARDKRGEALTYARMAECYLALGDFKSAIQYAEHAKTIFEELEDFQRIDQLDENVFSKIPPIP